MTADHLSFLAFPPKFNVHAAITNPTWISQMLEDMRAQDNAADEKRLNKTRANIHRLQRDLESLAKDLDRPNLKLSQTQTIMNRMKQFEAGLKDLKREKAEIKARMESRTSNTPSSSSASSSSLPVTVGARQRATGGSSSLSNLPSGPSAGRLPNESEREYLIRTGKITPFSAMSGLERTVQAPSSRASRTVADLTAGRVQQKERESAERMAGRMSKKTKDVVDPKEPPPSSLKRSKEPPLRANLRASDDDDVESDMNMVDERDSDDDTDGSHTPGKRSKPSQSSTKRKQKMEDSDDDGEYMDDNAAEDASDVSDSKGQTHSAEIPLDQDEDQDGDILGIDEDGSFIKRRVEENRDDGDEIYYQKRLSKWVQVRRLKRLKDVSNAISKQTKRQLILAWLFSF
jgi:DNA excision repair protein ERCC-6